MEIAVQSISPTGIDVINKSANISASFLDVEDLERVNMAEGVRDLNRITSLSDICITYVQIDSDRNIDFEIGIDSPTITMNFFLSSASLLQLSGIERPTQYDIQTHNVFYFPKTTYCNRWSKGTGCELLSINLSANYIKKYFPEEQGFDQFMQAIEHHLPTSLSPKALPITQQMLDIVYGLIHDDYDLSMRRLQIETKVFELLLLQFQQYNQLVGNQYTSFITKKLRDKIVHAKDIVDKNIDNPLGLIALAKMVGTNEYYLKKGFKELFGMSVFNYITSHRMEHAKRLLLREGCNVNETAFLLGYKDATNFTASFKRYFGYTPKKLILEKKVIRTL